MTIGRILGIVLLVVIAAALGYCASYKYPFPGTPPSASGEVPLEPEDSTETIRAQGRLEPAAGVLAVSALPGEEIVELKFRAGDPIEKKGEVLCVLGSLQIRQEEYKLARQKLETARAQLASELELGKLRVAAAKLSIDQAKARAGEIPPDDLTTVAKNRRDLAVTRLTKLQQLRDNPATRDAVTDAELEQQQLLIEQIDAELKQNSGKQGAAKNSVNLASQAAELDLQMAERTTDELEKVSPIPALETGVELARLAVESTEVRAPCKGTILEVYARTGERVANTPILQMADLDEMVCIAEVNEVYLGRIRDAMQAGRSVQATLASNALPHELSGVVIQVGQLIGAPALRDPNPLAQTDRRTAKVSIKLDPASTQVARNFVHLQVDVTIPLEPSGEQEG
jgi:HlyD family secretion protein